MKVLGGKIEDDKAYFGGKNKGKRGRGSKNKVIVLEYLKKWKSVCVEVLTNVTADRLLCGTVKKVRRVSIEYIDKWKDYHSLKFVDTDIYIDHDKKFVNGKIYIN
jgi:transposase